MRKILLAVLLILPLAGCAVPPALSIASLMMDAGSYAATGKSVADNGISIVAQQDCALFNIVTDGSYCLDSPTYETAVAALEPLPGTAPDAQAEAGTGTAQAIELAAAPFLADGLPQDGEALRPGLPSDAAFLADGARPAGLGVIGQEG
ncbi:hypothetical protein SAMN06265365_104163 [Tistlia consotensis]|uniref:Uncharacterized protein n=1 Tax=Tistlia consotensis USBA 355 TaxID=560819 RepID=A0A1Y6BUC9_9PROT|nr:hypothetical protein [Tistlia consotensis]SMF21784.1 hypothetical protein SAMN05428998_107131 [Tistlia consotensis USBA 355]SNR46568.1 hypothetical protein SAMN06265365_104163 [Tistlia consotensis]